MASHQRRSSRKNDSIIAAIDIGASKVSCFIARLSVEPGLAPHVDLLGVGQHGLPAFSKLATNPVAIEKSLRNAVDCAERMAETQISEACIAVSGRYLRTRKVGVDLELAGGVVTQDDINDSFCEGLQIAAHEGYAALHASPIRYKVDGAEIFSDPTGFSGGVLSTELLGVGARESVLDNLTTLVERSGLAVDAFAAAPVAAAEACLIEDEKELGVVFVDIGASSTGFALYDNGALIECGGVPLGGGHITKDIAQIFGTPLAHAERVKTLHGAALIGAGDENRCIDFPQLGVVGENVRASRADLCEVIIPRLEEIFELVLAQLPEDTLRRGALRRTVISGGGSLLVGARETAERVLSMKARIGRPIAIPGAPEAAYAPGFSVCAGLIQNYINLHAEGHSALGVSRQSLQQDFHSTITGGVGAWLRARF